MLSLIKINDEGRQLLSQKLTLYDNKPMSYNVVESKLNSLYYIQVSGSIIGYIQLYPMMYCKKNFMALEEIEIFEQYRMLKFGSKIIAYLRSKHDNLLILDIQDHALGFWLKVMGPEYWSQWRNINADVNQTIGACLYTGSVADYFRSTRVV
jgi:hypothetical protein